MTDDTKTPDTPKPARKPATRKPRTSKPTASKSRTSKAKPQPVQEIVAEVMPEQKPVAVLEPESRLPAPQLGFDQNQLNRILSAATAEGIDLDRMERMKAMLQELHREQQRMLFIRSLAAFQAGQQPIKRNKSMVHKERHIADYASYDAIHNEIKPRLTKFGLAFRTECDFTGGKNLVVGILGHIDGYEVRSQWEAPQDNSGAKNENQGKGSAASYARRYLLAMMLDLAFEDEEGSGELPTSDQHATILASLNTLTEVDNYGRTQAEVIREANDLTAFSALTSAIKARKAELEAEQQGKEA